MILNFYHIGSVTLRIDKWHLKGFGKLVDLSFLNLPVNLKKTEA